MKNIVKYTLAAAASVVMLASCDLNLVPIDAIAYEEGGMLIQTQANLNAFENGILASFRAVQNGTYITTEEVQFDYFNATIDFGNNYGSIHRCDYTFTTSDYDTEDMWEGHYSVIKNYNIVIANTDNVPENLKEKAKIVKGEALFFRAASYLTLARHFGPAYSPAATSSPCVPLVLKYDQNEKPSRATVGEVYAQIKADLDEAATILAGVSGKARSQKPTIDAVNALYARYYLAVQDYANAAQKAVAVIGTNKYALCDNATAFKNEFVDDAGKESIIQMYAKLNELPARINEYTLVSTTDKTESGYDLRPYYLPTVTLLGYYEALDLRSSWFGSTVSIKGKQVTLPVKNASDEVEDIKCFLKFAGNPALSSSNVQTGYNAATPLRIAEMYLIAAEACFRGGQTENAKTYLNTLQTARKATPTATVTLDDIFIEWRKEMVGEGQTLGLFKRFHKGFSGRPAQQKALEAGMIMEGSTPEYYTGKVLSADSPFLNWPVPVHDIKVNKNLVQNDGYGLEGE